MRVEDQRAKGLGRIAVRRRHHCHHGFENRLGADALLRRGEDHLVARDARDVGDLLGDHLRLRRVEVDLVDHGDERQSRLDRLVEIGERLGLDALSRVDDQQGSFAGGQRPRDLVREVNMARRVDEVELVALAIFGRVGHANGLQLDRDSALALEVHGVKHLVLHIALADRAGVLEQAVGQRRFAVVDVGDDAEVPHAVLC